MSSIPEAAPAVGDALGAQSAQAPITTQVTSSASLVDRARRCERNFKAVQMQSSTQRLASCGPPSNRLKTAVAKRGGAVKIVDMQQQIANTKHTQKGTESEITGVKRELMLVVAKAPVQPPFQAGWGRAQDHTKVNTSKEDGYRHGADRQGDTLVDGLVCRPRRSDQGVPSNRPSALLTGASPPGAVTTDIASTTSRCIPACPSGCSFLAVRSPGVSESLGEVQGGGSRSTPRFQGRIRPTCAHHCWRSVDLGGPMHELTPHMHRGERQVSRGTLGAAERNIRFCFESFLAAAAALLETILCVMYGSIECEESIVSG